MRTIKNGVGWSSRELKSVPKGVCNLCGGKGRYKETFKHKNPIIHHCLKCNGTGNVKIQVRYTGEIDMNRGLWSGSNYDVITENDSDYVILNRNKEMLQISKELFQLIN